MLRRRDKRREVSTIAALVLVPVRRGRRWRWRVRLLARHIDGSFQSEDVCCALGYFRKRVGRPLILVWDLGNQHRSAKTRAYVARHKQDFRLEWLPPYAPDLNPEEGCNGVVKSLMANVAPGSDAELRALARAAVRRVARQPDMLAAFVRHAGLEPY